jgi:Fe-S-cluster containining protein
VADWPAEARAAFTGASDAKRLVPAVVTFHRRLDEILEASVRGHAVTLACKPGCNYCCHLPVHVRPYEAFALATWLRGHSTPAQLEALRERLRGNVERTRALGEEGRKHANLACALLDPQGACTAYAARPAQCRKFHSTVLATCEASFARPEDDSIPSPEHPAVGHNAAVIIAQAANAAREAGFDAAAYDLNAALLEALDNPRAERRWRDGKKAFVGSS